MAPSSITTSQPSSTALAAGWPSWARLLTALLALSLLLCLDYVLLWALPPVFSADWSLLRSVYVTICAHIGSGGVLVGAGLLLAFCGFVARSRRWEVAGRWVVWAVLLSGFWAQVLKHLIGRPRPRQFVAHGELLPVGPSLTPSLDSLPSGHAMTVVAVACAVSGAFPAARWPLLIAAGLVALGRVVGGDHYLSDVVLGAWLGLILGSFLRARCAAEVGDEAA